MSQLCAMALDMLANALDQAAPLSKWKLPEELQTLRCPIEARTLKMGQRKTLQTTPLEIRRTHKVAEVLRDEIRADRHRLARPPESEGWSPC